MLKPTVKEKLEKIRKNMPDKVGYTMIELSDMIEADTSHINKICRRQGWLVYRPDSISRLTIALLISPKALKREQAKELNAT